MDVLAHSIILLLGRVQKRWMSLVMGYVSMCMRRKIQQMHCTRTCVALVLSSCTLAYAALGVQHMCMHVYVIVCTPTGCIAREFVSHLSVHMHTRVCTCMYRYPVALPYTHVFATVYVCAHMHNFLLCVFTRVHLYLDWCICRRQFAAPTHAFAFWAMSGMMTSLNSSRRPRGLAPRSHCGSGVCCIALAADCLSKLTDGASSMGVVRDSGLSCDD